MGFVIVFIIYQLSHKLMNSKRGIAFSIAAIAAVTVIFASGPLVANQQAQALPFGGFGGGGGGGGVGGFGGGGGSFGGGRGGGGFGFHPGFGFHHFGFFHHPFFFHRHFF